MITPIQQQKQLLRQEMRARRLAAPDRNTQAFKLLRDVFEANIELNPDAVIASYHAFRGEMDPAFLTDRLRTRRHAVALPVITGKNRILNFHLYEKTDPLVANPMGILEPDGTTALVEPDVLLVPLLAFDRHGHRLGYGGGYYDRTLADLRSRKKIIAIGIAYSFQEIAEIPTDAHDVKLDKIVTEVNVF